MRTAKTVRKDDRPTTLPAPDPCTPADAAKALHAAAGVYRQCPRCGELAVFRHRGRWYCLDCSKVTIG